MFDISHKILIRNTHFVDTFEIFSLCMYVYYVHTILNKTYSIIITNCELEEKLIKKIFKNVTLIKHFLIGGTLFDYLCQRDGKLMTEEVYLNLYAI